MAVPADRLRTDADNVAALAHGLYTRFGAQIEAYCRYRLRSREEAEDAVQTTFMNAFRALKRGTAPHAEQAWLFKIAQNVCVARQSSSTRRLRLEKPDDFQMLQELIPSPATSGADELIGLEDVLAGMPENQRRAILLREWQGLSYREIGEQLELSQASVEMLIFRARRALARGLEQQPAPRAERRAGRRLGQGLDLGGIAAALKSLFVGGAAVKAVGVAATAGTVAAVAALGAHKPLAPPPMAVGTATPSRRTVSARPPRPAPASTPTPAPRFAAAETPTVVPRRTARRARQARPVPSGVLAPAAKHDDGVDPPREGTAQATATGTATAVAVPAPAASEPPAAPVATAPAQAAVAAPSAPPAGARPAPAPRASGPPRVASGPPAARAPGPSGGRAGKQHGNAGRKAHNARPPVAHLPERASRRTPEAASPLVPDGGVTRSDGRVPGGGARDDGRGHGSTQPLVAGVPTDPTGAAPPPPAPAADPPGKNRFVPLVSSVSVQTVPADDAATGHGHGKGGNDPQGNGPQGNGHPGNGAGDHGSGKVH